jgi:hypothetical protein
VQLLFRRFEIGDTIADHRKPRRSYFDCYWQTYYEYVVYSVILLSLEGVICNFSSYLLKIN